MHRHEDIPNVDRYQNPQTSPVGLLEFALVHAAPAFRALPRDRRWPAARSIYDDFTEPQRECFRECSRKVRGTGCPRATQAALGSMNIMLRAFEFLRDAAARELGKFLRPSFPTLLRFPSKNPPR